MRERAEDKQSRRTLHAAPSDMLSLKAPLIIGGTGGSGTQALSKVLAHAGFFLGKNLNSDNDSLDVAEFLKHWTPQWVDAGNRELPSTSQARMDRHFLASLVRVRGEDLEDDQPWLVKNPRLMFLLPFLDRHYPNFQFIHMVRDGRDMAFSKNQGQLVYLGSKYLGQPVRDKDPVLSAALWSKANLAAQAFGRKILGDRYHQVRFEDLCENPKAASQALFDALRVNGDTQAAGQEIKVPSSLGRWKNEAPQVVADVQAACAPGLATFGYA